MDQTVSARRCQQLQSYKQPDILIVSYGHPVRQSSLTHSPVSGLLYSRHRISALWASTFRISSMLLKEWILQERNWGVLKVGGHFHLPPHSSLTFLSYLSIPLRSPDARCLPSGLKQMVLMPVLVSAICPSPGLSAFIFAGHSGCSEAVVLPSM